MKRKWNNYNWLWNAYALFIIILFWVLSACATSKIHPADMNYSKSLKPHKQKVSRFEKARIKVAKKTFRY